MKTAFFKRVISKFFPHLHDLVFTPVKNNLLMKNSNERETSKPAQPRGECRWSLKIFGRYNQYVKFSAVISSTPEVFKL